MDCKQSTTKFVIGTFFYLKLEMEAIKILISTARFVSVDYFTDVMSRKIANYRVFSTETNIHFHVSIHHT